MTDDDTIGALHVALLFLSDALDDLATVLGDLFAPVVEVIGGLLGAVMIAAQPRPFSGPVPAAPTVRVVELRVVK